MDTKENEMYNILSKHRADIEELIEPFYYRYKRYKFNFCLFIIYSETLNDDCFYNHIRETDKCTMIDDNLACVAFESMNAMEATTIIEKLLYHEQNAFNKPKSHYYSSIVCSSPDREDIINKSFMILEYAYEYKITNEVLNYDVIPAK